jgi:Na+-translocating ferredoxin:NAD+ oxidoreductase subunit B
MATMIILAAVVMLALAVLMGYVLGWANKAFHVEIDPRIEQVNEALPGANCGACGYIGCGEYAEATVVDSAAVDLCPVGGDSVATAVADILGVEVDQSWPFRPVVHCGADYTQRLKLSEYRGEKQCASANLIAGVQGCTYGCMGFGDCDRSCNFDAIDIVDGLATINYDKCVGCGACAKVCPRNIITMVPFKNAEMVVVKCANKDFGKDVKTVCKVGCLGCKACSRSSDVFTFTESAGSIPVLNYDDYDPDAMEEEIEVALDKCPMKRLEKIGLPGDGLVPAGDEEAPQIVQADFKTTVDDADWQG